MMTKKQRILMPLCALVFLSSHAFAAPHNHLAKPSPLCEASEKTLWSCVVAKNNKLASLCGSADLSSTAGYIQYRYGAAGNIELNFPASRVGSQHAFTYSRYTRPLDTSLRVAFVNNGYRYTLNYDNNEEIVDGERMDPGSPHSSIGIVFPDKQDKTLSCHADGTLMSIEDIVKNEDFLPQ